MITLQFMMRLCRSARLISPCECVAGKEVSGAGGWAGVSTSDIALPIS